MGLLSKFNLQDFIEKYNVSTLVELGTGAGTGLNYARTFDKLKSIYSCEIISSQAEKLQREIQDIDKRVSIFSGKSCDFLNFLLKQDSIKQQKSLIIWADSHLPGGDLGLNKYDAEPDRSILLPLETELDIFWNIRPPSQYRDVFLIDDVRLFKKLPIQGGDLESLGLGSITDYKNDFFSRWGETHDLEEILEHEGYLKMTPKQ